MTREEFGQKLKELRNRSKLTQTEVVENLWKIIVVDCQPLISNSFNLSQSIFRQIKKATP